MHPSFFQVFNHFGVECKNALKCLGTHLDPCTMGLNAKMHLSVGVRKNAFKCFWFEEWWTYLRNGGHFDPMTWHTCTHLMSHT